MLDLDRANQIGDRLAVLFNVPRSYLYVNDHTHEGITPGGFTIGLEGVYGYDDQTWTDAAADAMRWPVNPYGPGVFVEPRNGWCLALYPTDEPVRSTILTADEGAHCRACKGPIEWSDSAAGFIHLRDEAGPHVDRHHQGEKLGIWEVYA